MPLQEVGVTMEQETGAADAAKGSAPTKGASTVRHPTSFLLFTRALHPLSCNHMLSEFVTTISFNQQLGPTTTWIVLQVITDGGSEPSLQDSFKEFQKRRKVSP